MYTASGQDRLFIKLRWISSSSKRYLHKVHWIPTDRPLQSQFIGQKREEVRHTGNKARYKEGCKNLPQPGLLMSNLLNASKGHEIVLLLAFAGEREFFASHQMPKKLKYLRFHKLDRDD